MTRVMVGDGGGCTLPQVVCISDYTTRMTHFLKGCVSVSVVVCLCDLINEVATLFLKRCVSVSVVNLK